MIAASVAPYSVATPMVAHAYLGDHTDIDTTLKMLTEQSPLRGRPGLAEDVANAVYLLCLPEANMITGHTLVVDGGFCISG